ncbi:MAG TPA: leucyl/phenylalanyl-tRNA--protein transferase [Steroidobacteraceae bacterium]|nr:leucyl/phenylalanyl-tRNA--protein transferase [Steroidobacteraceae bacterium]
MKTITWLSPQDAPEWFPPLEQALDEPPGLLAAGGDLSPARLLAAYRRGIFPWYSPGQPVLWWSPDPRAVLFPEEFRCRRSLAKTLRNGGFSVTIDEDFPAVIDCCAAPRPHSLGTWITSDMRAAYVELHHLKYAHSIETRRGGQLVGGLYGVRLGGVFFGESMFSSERDASKVALAHLVGVCGRNSIELIDCQLPSRHLESLGSRIVPRVQFQALLRKLIEGPSRPRPLEPLPDTVAQ